MKVAIYARVSTEEQTVENQLPSMREWAKTRGHEVTEEYCENESSWRAGHQKELARLLNDLHTGKRKYDILLVWALDRLTRQGPETIFGMIASFRNLGVKVFSIQEPWLETNDSTTPLLIAVVSWVAEFESKRRSERTKAGLITAAANGRHPGRPAGSKDGKARKKTGYLLRWANK